jgi:hypothetical protein
MLFLTRKIGANIADEIKVKSVIKSMTIVELAIVANTMVESNFPHGDMTFENIYLSWNCKNILVSGWLNSMV